VTGSNIEHCDPVGLNLDQTEVVVVIVVAIVVAIVAAIVVGYY
jgi:hypothetical protein